MAKNSHRVAAALQTLVPQLSALDAMPRLDSVAITVFFNKDGDYSHVTPRYSVKTDQAHLTAPSAPAP